MDLEKVSENLYEFGPFGNLVGRLVGLMVCWLRVK